MNGKIITIVSTRPELIRLSLIIKKLDEIYGENHILIHTGQNFTLELKDNIINDLKLRRPDIQLNEDNKNGYCFAGNCMQNIEKILFKFNPNVDKILILGDVNGGFYSAYVARKLGFKIYHLESGNRCYNSEVPEEINRLAIDTFSYKHLVYTERSRENLISEGYPLQNIHVVGNPIYEVIAHDQIKKNKRENIITITLHRTENITNLKRLKDILTQISLIGNKEQIIFSIHPKLQSILEKNKKLKKIITKKNIKLNKPFTFNEFKKLEQKSKLVITDSGTVPEECAIFNTPCILLRNNTERPELLEVNQMVVSGTHNLFEIYKTINKFTFNGIPIDYNKKTSEIVVKIIMGEL